MKGKQYEHMQWGRYIPPGDEQTMKSEQDEHMQCGEAHTY